MMPSTSNAAGVGSSSQAAPSSSAPATASSSSGTRQYNAAEDNSSDSNEDEEDDDEQNWDDFDEADEELVKLPTKALFSDDILEYPEAALEQAKEKHGVDIIEFIAINRKFACSSTGLHNVKLIRFFRHIELDYAQIIRLVNYVRRVC